MDNFIGPYYINRPHWISPQVINIEVGMEILISSKVQKLILSPLRLNGCFGMALID